MKPSPRLRYGERVVIDNYVVDRTVQKPDSYIHIPDLSEHNIRGESVPLRFTHAQTGVVQDIRERYVNGAFWTYNYCVLLDSEHRCPSVLGTFEWTVWVLANEHRRKIRKAE